MYRATTKNLLICFLLAGWVAVNTAPTGDQDVEIALEKALALIRAKTSTARPLRARKSDELSQRIVQTVSQELINAANQTEDDGFDGPDGGSAPADDSDSDYCPDFFMIGERKVSLKTMENIIKLRIAKTPHDRIKKQYSWWDRQRLQEFKDCLARGFKKKEAWSILGETVAGMVRDSRDKGLPVRGFMIRNWARNEAKKWE